MTATTVVTYTCDFCSDVINVTEGSNYMNTEVTMVVRPMGEYNSTIEEQVHNAYIPYHKGEIHICRACTVKALTKALERVKL